MKPNWHLLNFALALTAAAVVARTAAAQSTTAQSTTSHATFVSASEINAAVAKSNTGPFSDSPLRVVPIEGKYNVGVAVVRRTKVGGRVLPDALIHDDVTEVYQILAGEGVLVTGGALKSATPLTASAVVAEIGPGSAGQSIVGGTSHHIVPGDIVVIPPHTPHGFVNISAPRIVYAVIRIDPQQVLELRSKPE